MSLTILIPDRISGHADVEAQEFPEGTRILTPFAMTAEEVPDEYWREADAILVWHDVAIDAEVIEKLDRCRVLVRVGVGVDSVDLAAANQRGLPVCNVPDYGTTDVADHAMALYLSLSRGLPAYSRQVRDGGWSWEDGPQLRRIAGASFGILGLGRIGTAVAARAKAFGLDVHFFDPYKADGWDKSLGLTRHDQLDGLLAACNAISIHTPLTAETAGLVDRAFVGSMRAGALLINTARGGVLDLDAVEDGIRSGHLGGFGSDVLPIEPPDLMDRFLRDWAAGDSDFADRIILTPHAAFYCEEGYREMRQKAAREALRVLNGEAPRNCVNAPTVSS